MQDNLIRKMVACAALFCALILTTQAQNESGSNNPASRCVRTVGSDSSPNDIEWSLTITESLKSRYLVPGVLNIAYPHPVLGSDVIFSRKQGRVELSFGLTDVQAFHKCLRCTEGDEVDPTIAVKFDLGRNRALELRYTHLFLTEEAGGDYANPSVVYSRVHELSQTLTVTPFAKLDAFIQTRKHGPRSGLIPSIGADLQKVLPRGFAVGYHAEVGNDVFGIAGFAQKSMLYRHDLFISKTLWGGVVGVSATVAGTNEYDRPGRIIPGFYFTRRFKL